MRWERKLLGTKPDHNSQCSARACSRKSTGAEMTGSPLTGLRQGAAPGCQTFQERRDTQPRKSVRVGASPTCDLFILCLSLYPRFPSPCFYPALPVSTVPWLASPAPPPGSLSPLTPELCLLWQLLCLLPELAGLPPAKHNEAWPGKARLQVQTGPSGTGNGLQAREAAQR